MTRSAVRFAQNFSIDTNSNQPITLIFRCEWEPMSLLRKATSRARDIFNRGQMWRIQNGQSYASRLWSSDVLIFWSSDRLIFWSLTVRHSTLQRQVTDPPYCCERKVETKHVCYPIPDAHASSLLRPLRSVTDIARSDTVLYYTYASITAGKVKNTIDTDSECCVKFHSRCRTITGSKKPS